MSQEIDDRDMRLVMVIGKYFMFDVERNCPDYGGIDRNIYLARQLARKIFALPNRNVFVFTPHLNTAHFEVLTNVGEPQYQSGDREMIRRAGDAGVVVPNWRDSTGSKNEIRLFNELGRPVFEDLESLSAWLGGLPDFKFDVRTDEVGGSTYLITVVQGRKDGPLTEKELFAFTS